MGELPKLSLSEIDPVKRHERYCVMQTLIHNESGMVIPCFVNLTDGIVGNLMGATNVPIEPVGACDSGRRMSGSTDCS